MRTLQFISIQGLAVLAAIATGVSWNAKTEEIPRELIGPALLPENPSASWPCLSPASESMGLAVRDLSRAVVLIGNPTSGEATAFVISKKHRLLATNAHVADGLATTGSLIALCNGTTTPCKVDRVWYHPGIVRRHEGCLSIRCQDPLHGPVAQPCPDVAVVHLADGPELTAEFSLATPQELDNLFAQPVSVLGFPGYDNRQWPATGERPQATYRNGVVNRLSSFSGDVNGASKELQLVQHSMDTWFGFSGSPIFLPNGHVIAIDAQVRPTSKNGLTTKQDFGVRVDCLWELLVHHQLAEQMGLSIDRAALNLRRYEEPNVKEDDLRTAIRLVHECNRLMLDSRYELATEYCNHAIRLAPEYANAYQMRSEVIWRHVAMNKNRLSHEATKSQLQGALDDAQRYLKMSSAPEALPDLCLRALWLQTVMHGTPSNPQVIALMTKLLDDKELDARQRASAHCVRAIASGYSSASLADLNEAIRLAPYGKTGYMAYDARAVYWWIHGDSNQAASDQRRVQELLTAEQLAAEASDLLAPSPVSVDDAKKALGLIQQACQITHYEYWSHLDLLAKAYQDVGDGQIARAWGSKTLALAPESERPRIRADLNAYRSTVSSQTLIPCQYREPRMAPQGLSQ